MRALAAGLAEVSSLRANKEQENERAALTALIDYVVETTCNSQNALGRDGADKIRRSLSDVVLPN